MKYYLNLELPLIDSCNKWYNQRFIVENVHLIGALKLFWNANTVYPWNVNALFPYLSPFHSFVTTTVKTSLWRDKKNTLLSDAAKPYRSWSSRGNIFITFCAIFTIKYYHKHVKTCNQGRHSLFIHKACFHRWHDIYI